MMASVMVPRDFPVADLLSVITGKHLSADLMAISNLLNHMAGEWPLSHQTPRFMVECGPALLLQYPQLGKADCEGVTPENYEERRKQWTVQFGETLPVAPLLRDAHERIDPLSEVAEKVHPDRIIVVPG